MNSALLPRLTAAASVALGLSGCVSSRALEQRERFWEDEPEEESALSSAEASGWSLQPVGSVGRIAGPPDLGAITYVSNHTYWVASDSDGIVCELTLSVDPQSGAIRGGQYGRTIRLPDRSDIEGLAFDPLTQMLWTSDEAGPTVSGYRMSDWRRMFDLPLPLCYRRCRANLSLESLSIREDGLEMWTCNEEPLKGDGMSSTKTTRSLVRLSRFLRKDCLSPWRFSGQWAYPVGRLHGGSFRGILVRGVSDLCVLPDGTLLVLEREFSWSVYPCFHCRIYQVGFEGATDVTTRETLSDEDIVPVERQRLWSDDKTFCNYEGMCLGERLADGSRLLLLVSDGDSHAAERIFSFRLRRTE